MPWSSSCMSLSTESKLLMLMRETNSQLLTRIKWDLREPLGEFLTALTKEKIKNKALMLRRQEIKSFSTLWSLRLSRDLLSIVRKLLALLTTSFLRVKRMEEPVFSISRWRETIIDIWLSFKLKKLLIKKLFKVPKRLPRLMRRLWPELLLSLRLQTQLDLVLLLINQSFIMRFSTTQERLVRLQRKLLTKLSMILSRLEMRYTRTLQPSCSL